MIPLQIVLQFLVYLAALAASLFFIYLAAKLVAYGWMKGCSNFREDHQTQPSEEDRDGD